MTGILSNKGNVDREADTPEEKAGEDKLRLEAEQHCSEGSQENFTAYFLLRQRGRPHTLTSHLPAEPRQHISVTLSYWGCYHTLSKLPTSITKFFIFNFSNSEIRTCPIYLHHTKMYALKVHV